MYYLCLVRIQKTIQEIYQANSYILDPHTAVAAVEAIKKSDSNNHFVVLSTAHPAKVPKVYEELNIEINSLPAALSGLYKKEEHLHSFDADYNQVTDFIKLTIECRLSSISSTFKSAFKNFF